MSSRRLSLSSAGAFLFVLVLASPAWAAGESSTFQSWLVEHRSLLWMGFYIQLGLLIGLCVWEVLFQMQRRKAPANSSSTTMRQTSEPMGLVDPFKTQVTSRRSLSSAPPQDTEHLRHFYTSLHGENRNVFVTLKGICELRATSF